MKTLTAGLQGSTVAVNQSVAYFKKAEIMNRKGLVGSPYWENGFNPHYPKGFDKSEVKRLTLKNRPTRKVIDSRMILSSGLILNCKEFRKTALKKAKAECINKEVKTFLKFVT